MIWRESEQVADTTAEVEPRVVSMYVWHLLAVWVNASTKNRYKYGVERKKTKLERRCDAYVLIRPVACNVAS